MKAVNNILNQGIATFFDPETEGGSQGACGPFADENSQIVAMNAAQYGPMNRKSPWCGKKLKIMYKDKYTVATVTDACPGCSEGSLDLTPAVWGQLERNYDKGIIPITWHVCEDDCYD
ncbi:RlpA-like double-psi beta-barrel-protein domain-containing protein-containing protein [Pilobolus umbonatus]|nr:RlpA-like double-psi beta-barrel-protein domain-containing protein-containing protein [Pilobolus umbonatus]